MFAFVEKGLARFGSEARETFEVSFTDGSRYRNRRGPQDFAVRFRTRAPSWRIAAFGHVGLLEAYFDGDVDIEGSLREGARRRHGRRHRLRRTRSSRMRNRWHELPHSNAQRASRRSENAEFHYALGPSSTSSGSTIR